MNITKIFASTVLAIMLVANSTFALDDVEKAWTTALVVKLAQRNPDSFVLETALVSDRATCVVYRGQNGFGGMNKGAVISTTENGKVKMYLGTDPDFFKVWERECKSGVRNVTEAVVRKLKKP